MKITKQRLKQLIKEELEAHERAKSSAENTGRVDGPLQESANKLTKSRLKQLIKKQLAAKGLFESNTPTREPSKNPFIKRFLQKRECVDMFCDFGREQDEDESLVPCESHASALYDEVCDIEGNCPQMTPEEIVELMVEADYDAGQDYEGLGYDPDQTIRRQYDPRVMPESLGEHKITKQMIKKLIKEEIDTTIFEKEEKPAASLRSLKKEWRYLKARLEGNFSGACGEAVRHRRSALKLTQIARKEGKKELVKSLRAHRKEVTNSMNANNCGSA
jgi:hypothetical protein